MPFVLLLPSLHAGLKHVCHELVAVIRIVSREEWQINWTSPRSLNCLHESHELHNSVQLQNTASSGITDSCYGVAYKPSMKGLSQREI